MTEPDDVIDEPDAAPDVTVVADLFIAQFERDWCQLTCGPCGKTVSFVNPDEQRMGWYTGSHRCGPFDDPWREGPTGS